jgi:hypothetical protein
MRLRTTGIVLKPWLEVRSPRNLLYPAQPRAGPPSGMEKEVAAGRICVQQPLDKAVQSYHGAADAARSGEDQSVAAPLLPGNGFEATPPHQ